MNIATITGIIVGLGLIIGGILIEGTSILFFLNAPGLMIVIGGTLSATLVSVPLGEFKRIMHALSVVMRKEPPNHEQYINFVVNICKKAKQEGTLSLEKDLIKIDNLFLKDAVEMLVDGYKVEEIQEILTERITNKIDNEKAEIDLLNNMSKFAPAFGLVGTLIGLIALLANLDTGSMSSIGPSMAVALSTTFYGVIFANLFFRPMAIKMDKRMRGEVKLMHMVHESIVMIAQEWHPAKVQDYLNCYVRPGTRATPNRR